MQSLALEYSSLEELADALYSAGDEQELGLPCCEGLCDGQWIVASINVGHESTTVAARVEDRGQGLRLTFADRDWRRLSRFALGEGPPSMIPAYRAQVPEVVLAPPGTRVLVVDDDAATQHVVCQLLSASGVSPEVATSGEEALAVLESTRFDLLVLDWSLPGINGLELCKMLRCHRRLSALPVLFLTAHSADEDLVRAFEAGADDFVSKPFRAPELRARVLGLLRRTLPEVSEAH